MQDSGHISIRNVPELYVVAIASKVKHVYAIDVSPTMLGYALPDWAFLLCYLSVTGRTNIWIFLENIFYLNVTRKPKGHYILSVMRARGLPCQKRLNSWLQKKERPLLTSFFEAHFQWPLICIDISAGQTRLAKVFVKPDAPATKVRTPDSRQKNTAFKLHIRLQSQLDSAAPLLSGLLISSSALPLLAGTVRTDAVPVKNHQHMVDTDSPPFFSPVSDSPSPDRSSVAAHWN